MVEQKEEALSRLEKLYQNSDTGMTQDRYLEMMEQLGQEPIQEEIPPAWEDLPDLIINAVSVFNSLGDRVYPEIGYIGKDYTNLPILIDVFGINDTEYLIEVLHFLDGRAIEKSAETLKRERDKLKRSTSGSQRSSRKV